MSKGDGTEIAYTMLRAVLFVAGMSAASIGVLQSGMDPSSKVLSFGFITIIAAFYTAIIRGTGLLLRAIEENSLHVNVGWMSTEASRLGLDANISAIDMVLNAENSPAVTKARGSFSRGLYYGFVEVTLLAFVFSISFYLTYSNWSAVTEIINR